MAQALIEILDHCGLHWLAQQQWLAYLVVGLVQVALILALVMTCVAVYTWMERKISGRIQDRLGPTRVGGRFGWLQPAADGLKLLCKEDLVPAGADGILFRVAPYLNFCAAFIPFLALPFAPGWVVQPLDSAAFFILAIGGLEVFGVILAGYASGSKWSLYGAMREAAQVVSFEIPLGMCVVVPVLMAGTMNLTDIAQQQAGWVTSWNLVNPFALATFLIYMVCATAGTNRAPFDLPEAESELVAGFMTEYSGFRWAMFFMGEYCAMFLLALLGAILFCGGWNGPIPIATMLGLTPQHGDIAGFVGNFLGMCGLISKGVLGVIFMMWMRWTLPRLRIDQVMTTCLKYCVPLASIMLVGTMVSMFVLRGGISWHGKPEKTPAKQSQRTETNSPLPPGEGQGVRAEADCKLQNEEGHSAPRVLRCPLSSNLQFSTLNLQFSISFPVRRACQRRTLLTMSTIHWDSFFFLFFALVTCVFAVAVVVSNNIVRMAAYLVASLCGVAGLFFLSGAQFLGAMQLMLYVGGTVVLLVFGVMLTAKGPFVSMQSGGGQWIMALLAGGSLLVVLLQTVGQVQPMKKPTPAAVEAAATIPTTTQLGAGLVGVRTDKVGLVSDDAEKPVGYLLPFEIISLHLLVVLVGAAFLARAKRRVGAREQGLELSDERLGRDER